MCKLIQTFFVAVFACGGLSAQTPAWQPSPGHTQVPIWPKEPPDAQPAAGPEEMKTSSARDAKLHGGGTVKDSLVAGRPWVEVSNVSRPTMTVYSPKGKNTGVAVVVFPGGGYKILAIDLEGTEAADWLTSKGITCVLLKYRVPFSGPYMDERRGRVYPKHRWRCKMRRGRWDWCAFTPQSGISIRTRSECLGFRPAGMWWQG